MSDLQRVKDFIEGYMTGIDFMTSNTDLKPNEYQTGYRHAFDAMAGFLDDIEANAIESTLTAAKEGQ